ncbi:MAG: NAD(P)/FAD-dependent oxidoreductase [Christensenellales bacterium]
MYDTIIIGAGPAGLTAAIYVQRAGKTALVLEAMAVGGQIRNTPEIENYPAIARISGMQYSDDLAAQAVALGATIKREEVKSVELEGKIKTIVTRKETYTAKSVIIAVGAKSRELGVDREEDLFGCGVSYCAICDGAFFAGKAVAVSGGGNTAIDDALFLAERCSKVYLIHRRDAFRAEQIKVEQLGCKSNVEFVLGYTVDALLGDECLQGVVVKDKQGNNRQLDVSGIFVAIGKIPNTTIFEGKVGMDEQGYILAGEDCRTNVEGVWVAGDCRAKHIRQLTTAVADGTVAALGAVEFVRG